MFLNGRRRLGSSLLVKFYATPDPVPWKPMEEREEEMLSEELSRKKEEVVSKLYAKILEDDTEWEFQA
eukprot:5126521-Pyramimonas_sp.AAC.1